MMIKKCLSKISILLICSFSLLSCNSNNFNRKLLDNYTIEKSELISDGKISRISNIVNIKTIVNFQPNTIGLTTPLLYSFSQSIALCQGMNWAPS